MRRLRLVAGAVRRRVEFVLIVLCVLGLTLSGLARPIKTVASVAGVCLAVIVVAPRVWGVRRARRPRPIVAPDERQRTILAAAQSDSRHWSYRGDATFAVVADAGVQELCWGRALAAQTLEAGSITKMLTGLLLCDLVTEGAMGLDDPVGPLLGVPALDGTTFEHLATHTSGLPRIPRRIAVAAVCGDTDPYARWTEERLLAVVSRPREGRGFHYSNLGYALLGAALARAVDAPYTSLVAGRVLGPLGMRTADFTRMPTVDGHDPVGLPAPVWNLGAFIPAGGLRWRLADAICLAHGMLAPPGPLRAAVELMVVPRAPRPGGGHAGLGVMIAPTGVLWHNGATAGYGAFVAVDRRRSRGIAVVADAPLDRATEHTALHLLRARNGSPDAEDVDGTQ